MAATYARTQANGGPLNPLAGSTNLESRRRDPSSAYTTAATKSPTRRKESPVVTATTAPTTTATAAAAAGTERKQKEKKAAQEKPVNLPDPPQTVVDNEGVQWTRGRLLGSGGFARVYDVISEKGEMRAFKVIAKKHLQSKKTRAKILAEIMIHSSITHPNVVAFEDAIEDDEHVYFKLELCKAGSMNDMVKKRGRYTDAEARFFMVQILAGCQGMHTSNIIHRDLKLGNIFLDEGMNVKIGDFGLAALLKEVGERKKTVCGTPNYIAPEVLYDDGEGHSFEVDIWSVGVILYTMLVGRPPFQTSDIQKIYARIKNNDYEIPAEAGLRPEAQDLITSILAPKPSDRPSLIEIMNHPWFTVGPIPTFIPMHATKTLPKLNLPATPAENARNFEFVKQKSAWIPNADDLVEEDEDVANVDPREELKQQELLEEEREKIDLAFKRAIQPASPISALLKASRQPLIKTGGAGAAAAPTSSARSSGGGSGAALARQLSALSLSRTAAATSTGKAGSDLAASKSVPFDKENARPAAEPMGPPRTYPSVRRALDLGGANLAPSSEFEAAEERRMLGQKARLVAGMSGATVTASSRPTTAGSEDEAPGGPVATIPPKTSSNINTMIHYLNEAVQATEAGIEYQPLGEDGQRVVYNGEAPSPRIFIISWLDHSEKYGLGYALSDGTVGVYFRDSTSMSINCARTHCDYMPSSRRRAASGATEAGKSELEVKRENYDVEEYNAVSDRKTSMPDEQLPFPLELHPKVKVLRYFEQEIMDRLYGADSPLTFRDTATSQGMTFVFKWYRCHQAIVFRLSNGVVQFNFYDHTKVFLSEDGLVVSVIPPMETTGGVQTMKSYALAEVVAISHPERSAREAETARAGKEATMRITTPSERRMVRGVLKKLKVVLSVLVTTASSGSTPGATPSSASMRTVSSSTAAGAGAIARR